jgi:organic radical activating enzyme
MPTSAELPDDFQTPSGEPTKDTSSSPSTYTVKEIFRTVQGEGYWGGTPAVFLRLALCNMWSGYEGDRERDARRNTPGDEAWGCPMWCDTEFTKEGADELSAGEIADRILGKTEAAESLPLIVVTGGEPLLQMDAELCATLHDRFPDTSITVETNGTQSLTDTFGTAAYHKAHTPDWVCCSPKIPDAQLQIDRCDEVKLVVPDFVPSDYPGLVERCRPRATPHGLQKHLYVQPEDGDRFDLACTMVKEIATTRTDWRISTQSHKTIQIA